MTAVTGPAQARAALAADGPFARHLAGFRVRVEQQDMAAAVAATLVARDTLVCEAGTGTGKTLAYLVPVVQAGGKSIISTATRTLQDQLFQRDLPLVLGALGAASEVALLKGRQNYLCHYRLERARGLHEVETRRLPLLDALSRWAESSERGDLEEMRELDEDAGLRSLITSTRDNCLGQDCPHFERCFVARARRTAQASDIVVVNHHLLFADLVLRETGFAELLPQADAIVLDEAHKLPDIASTFFSRAVSSAQLNAWLRDARVASADEAPDTPDLISSMHMIELAQVALTAALGATQRRLGWREASGEASVAQASAALMAALDEADAVFAEVAARGPALANCHARITALAARWRRFAAGDDDERVHWVEIGPRSASFFDTPLSVAREFSACRATSDAAWIMTSATLAVAGSFSHFTTALGLSGAVERLWASPFDYASQALLYLPPLACEPRATGFEEALVAAALPVLEASRGRAFMLFTSFRALYRCADLLRAQSSFPLLVQGEAPRSELLRRFHTIDRAVLLGTATFWEGIDVRGERLSCVIIDKLPFAVPDDPVLRARSAALAARGDDAFELLQLPEAITALKQGAGRLIRAVDDRGVLMIADVRLRRRQYGSTFLASLPPMPVTEDLADIRRFYADGACAPLYSTPDVDRA